MRGISYTGINILSKSATFIISDVCQRPDSSTELQNRMVNCQS
jgi:hypothetical protein